MSALEPGQLSPQRAAVGSARDLRGRLPTRHQPPLAVALWSALFGGEGLLGSAMRRRARRSAGAAAPAVLGLAAAVVTVWPVPPVPDRVPWYPAILLTLAAMVGLLGWRALAVLREGRELGHRASLELGALALVLATGFSRLATARGLAGEASLDPLAYLVLCAWAALAPGRIALLLLVLAVSLEGARWWGGGHLETELPATAARLVFAGLFTLQNRVLLGARREAGRRAERAEAARRGVELERRARELRLLAPSEAGEGDRAERAERLTEAAVLEAGAATRGLLEVARAGLRAHGVAAWSLSEDDTELVLWEGRADGARLATRLPAGEGPLGGVVKRIAPVRLHGQPRSANHYDDNTRPGALVAVPLLSREGGHLRGVVLADRLSAEPFSEDEERLLVAVAAELARAVTAERLIRDGRALREEKEALHHAIESMNRASTPRQVFDALLASAARGAALDFGAVTLVEEEGDTARHRIVRATRLSALEGAAALPPDPATAELEGKVFEANGGLVACVVRLGSSLPGRPLRPGEAIVFDDATRLRGLASLKVLPLRAGERVLGTLVVGSRRQAAFPGEVVRQLELLAMQAGDTLLRAQLFEATERLATTDGLTGLVNHRTFQERLERHLAEARRYGKKLSLLLTDVDHFKAVNDTYGHPAGDQVLRGVARLLQTEARVTDVAARYGGEEFALVMPETDLAGALRTAERLREAVAAASFQTGTGDLRVTISIGVASFPGDGEAKAMLVEVADGGLYHAKRHGRNQTVALSRARGRKRVH